MFDRFASLGHGSILSRTQREVQREQAPAQSTPEVPSTPLEDVQYTVIEPGGRRAIDITESGEIVGTNYSTPERIHAAYWSGSQSAPIDLGTLPGLNSGSVAINPRREMVGNTFNDDQSVERALFWASPGSGPVELPGRPVDLQGGTYDINPSGQIVGYSIARTIQCSERYFGQGVMPRLSISLSWPLGFRWALPPASMLPAGSKVTLAPQTSLNVTRSSGPTAPASRWR